MRVFVRLSLYIMVILVLVLTDLNAKDSQYAEFESAFSSVSVYFKNKPLYKPVN